MTDKDTTKLKETLKGIEKLVAETLQSFPSSTSPVRLGSSGLGFVGTGPRLSNLRNGEP